MSRRFAPVAVLVPLVALSLASLASLGATIPPITTPPPPPLTVHEWGTFTSIAGSDGRALSWTPLDSPEDLPCFVERYDARYKGGQSGTVRMETPVLYFYAPDETSVDVTVKFHDGTITEWYPRAKVTPRIVTYGMEKPGLTSSATWSGVRVTPEAAAGAFPVEQAASHYYHARDTDAAPIQVGAQQEKFLFYRGIGAFQPPISATIGDDGSIAVKNPSGAPLGDVILFENRGGKMAYAVQQTEQSDATFMPLLIANDSTPPTSELEQILIARDLFPREAKAMVDTWRDSWFEEGARLFYIAPRPAIDTILPLDITPKPTEIARAFVGRLELITPRTEQDVSAAIDANNGIALARYGRFLRPIVSQLVAKNDRENPGLRSQMINGETPLERKAYAAIAPVTRAQLAARPPCPARPVLEDRTTQRR